MARRGIAALIALATAFALFHLVVVPWRCNIIEARVARLTGVIAAEPDPARIRHLAERNVRSLEDCLASCPTDVQLAMLTGTNQMMLERYEAAAATFALGLRNDQRPELYRALASAQLAAGKRSEAIANLVTAGDFAGKDYVLEVDDVPARMEAYAIVAEHEAKAARARGEGNAVNLVLNGEFRKDGPRGATTRDTGSGQSWPSAADRWNVWSSAPSTVVTSLLPSTRTPGKMMLRVAAGAPASGIFQSWGEKRRLAPASTKTSAWVFVRKGRVYIGTGNGWKTFGDAYSRTTGKWELLEARNGSCPSSQTILYSATPDTDFDVDRIDVFEVPGPPCEQR